MRERRDVEGGGHLLQGCAPFVVLAFAGCGGAQTEPSPLPPELTPPAQVQPAAEAPPSPTPAPPEEPMPRLDGPVAYHCFDVRWVDGDRNSECVRDLSQCERDLASMRGYATPDAVFRGCFPVSSAYCYDATGELCFVKMRDCEHSRTSIPGGGCGVRR